MRICREQSRGSIALGDLPAGDGGLFLCPTVTASDDEICIPHPAFRTAQQPLPIDDGHVGAVLGADIGVGAAIAAEHDSASHRRTKKRAGPEICDPVFTVSA